MKRGLPIVLVACITVGCSRSSTSEILPGAEVVRNGDYALHVKTWPKGESIVALTYTGRTVYVGNAYDTNKLNGTICISTNPTRDIFYMDDHRDIGHGSISIDVYDRTSGRVITYLDLNEDGEWDAKTVNTVPRSTVFVRNGADWEQRSDDNYQVTGAKTNIVGYTDDERRLEEQR